MGLGPYRVAEWEPGSYLTLRAYEAFYAGAPKIDVITIRFYGDAQPITAGLLGGTIDGILKNALDFDSAMFVKNEWEGAGKRPLVVIQTTHWRMLGIQFRNPQPREMLDVRVRRGLYHAIDREALIEAVLAGQSPVSHTFIPPDDNRWEWVKDTVATYPYNPGRALEWWREDHPAEREMRPYLQDPSGNLLQLIPADPPRPLIDHAMLAVHELNLGEKLHVEILGGELDYYHAWKTSDQWEARAWADGDDPCAPWTRAKRYNNFYHVVTPRPTPQVYTRYGDTRLGMVVASKHVQEPPEEMLKGTPRIILQGASSAREIASYLPTVDPAAREGPPRRGIPFRREGNSIYFRDRSGNFLQIECPA